MPEISLREKIILIIFGVFLVLIILEISLRIGGFIFISLQEHRNSITLKQKAEYRILCLGESTTASGGSDSYPSQLEQILNTRNIGIKFSVINKGIPGTDTTAILSLLKENLSKYNPDMVITMMGVNDCGAILPYKNNNASQFSIFLRNLRVYKLAKLIWMHLIAKVKERENYFLTNIHPHKTTYRISGWNYLRNGEYSKAENAFKKHIELNPNDELAHIGLRWAYHYQKKYAQALETVKRSMKINLQNPEVFKGLRHIYKNDKDYRNNLEGLLKEAVRLNASESAYIELAWVYKTQAKYALAEELLKAAIELNPESEEAYGEFGLLYIDQGKYAKAEQLFKQSIEKNPQKEKLYGGLIMLYEQTGKEDYASEYTQKLEKLRTQYYNPLTGDNYRRIKEILDNKRVTLVCMQYPMRSIQPLKNIFTRGEGVIFVDNQGVFKEALRRESLEEYFRDMFAGDFGHCTRKGNQLIAENLANTILKEHFNSSRQ